MWEYTYYDDVTSGKSSSNFLMHYGVPGMRWGIRRVRNKLAKALGKRKEEITESDLKKLRKDANAVTKDWRKAVDSKVGLVNQAKSRIEFNRKLSDNYYNGNNKKYTKLVNNLHYAENTYRQPLTIAGGSGAGLVGGMVGYAAGSNLARRNAKANYDEYGRRIKDRKNYLRKATKAYKKDYRR